MGRGRTCPCPAEAHCGPRPRPLLTSRCLLCLQTDTSDPEKVVSAFLKVSSVFKDEAPVRTAVQDAVGNVGCGSRAAPVSSRLRDSVTFLGTDVPLPLPCRPAPLLGSRGVLSFLFSVNGETEVVPRAAQLYAVRTRPGGVHHRRAASPSPRPLWRPSLRGGLRGAEPLQVGPPPLGGPLLSPYLSPGFLGPLVPQPHPKPRLTSCPHLVTSLSLSPCGRVSEPPRVARSC